MDTREVLLSNMKSYRDDLELIVSGDAYKLQGCDDPMTADQVWGKLLAIRGADEFIDILLDVETADDVKKVAKLLDENIEALIDKGYIEQFDLYDYLADNALDMDFTIGSDGKFKSGIITLACGGPGIWIDTRGAGHMIGAWSNTEASIPISMVLSAALEEYLEQSYESVKG